MEAIAANGLLLLCGAGLSMSPPSSLPSAAMVANNCATKYNMLTGGTIPQAVQGDIELISQHFRRCNREVFFIGNLIQWSDFKSEPNRGHEAVADFLACRVLFAGITTNFDTLVEIAASRIGEPDFRAIVDVSDMPQQTLLSPYLKLHGCEVRNRFQTIWCRDQLSDQPIAERMNRFRNWLAMNLLGRDVLFVGFWSDWVYLTELLVTNLTAISPQHVYLIDPASAEILEQKALGLWSWAHGPGITFHHIPESGSDFLDELRRRWSRLFLSQLSNASNPTYTVLFGTDPTANPALHDGFDSQTLYALRRDLTGTPRTAAVRDNEPQSSDHIAAAIHRRLLESGAIYSEHAYRFNEQSIRVVSGRGRVLSAVKAQFQGEPPLPTSADAVVCAGAIPDWSPSNFVRATESPTVVRSGFLENWTTHEGLLAQLGGRHV